MSQDKQTVFLVKVLQAYVKDNFINTCYNTDTDNSEYFQKKQYDDLVEKIKSIEDEYPGQLEKILNNWTTIVIPTIEEVSGIGHMQNIGTSATKCLQKFEEAEKAQDTVGGNVPKQSDDTEASTSDSLQKAEVSNNVLSPGIATLIANFLKAVIRQAKDALERAKKAAEDTPLTGTDIENTIKIYFQNYADDYNTKIQKAIESCKSEAETARTHSENAKSAAQEVLNKLKKSTSTANQAAKAATLATKAASKATKAASEADETAKNMLPNMLSALGIFVGIVVAVVACYLSIVLAQHTEGIETIFINSRPFQFMLYLLMGHITLAVVFLLMYLISRISGHSLACSCNRFELMNNKDSEDSVCDCSKCKHKCSVPVRFKLRYPYLFGINFFCFMGYFVLALWQFINVYYRAALDKFILSCNPLLVLSVILIVLAFFLGIIFGFVFRFKKK